MVKQVFQILLIIVIVFTTNSTFARGRCSGDAYCTACSNCSGCKNCSEQGGTCGVCATYEEVETTPVVEPDPTTDEPVNSETNVNQDNEIKNFYDDSTETTSDSGTSYGWLWVLGIIGVLVLFGASGKK